MWFIRVHQIFYKTEGYSQTSSIQLVKKNIASHLSFGDLYKICRHPGLALNEQRITETMMHCLI